MVMRLVFHGKNPDQCLAKCSILRVVNMQRGSDIFLIIGTACEGKRHAIFFFMHSIPFMFSKAAEPLATKLWWSVAIAIMSCRVALTGRLLALRLPPAP